MKTKTKIRAQQEKVFLWRDGSEEKPRNNTTHETNEYEGSRKEIHADRFFSPLSDAFFSSFLTRLSPVAESQVTQLILSL